MPTFGVEDCALSGRVGATLFGVATFGVFGVDFLGDAFCFPGVPDFEADFFGDAGRGVPGLYDFTGLSVGGV